MSLLDQLWDDTVAGPRPDTGLGKLRKHSTFSFRPNSGKEPEVANGGRSTGEEAGGGAVRVTRSIMIVKPPQDNQKDSPPVSPAGSTPPVSPFSGKLFSVAVERKLSGSVGGRHRLLTRGLMEWDPKVLLLRTTFEL
ncbi:dormancy/auxin associated protein Drm3 [Striga asiatica]|uniref:Dormancy/auxin associated protein Drm3 n=1 Tax=Striga asiatica TaxID=4170 RepID=A0A5A7RES1_STRAF|nr:dormancy/auxin associated protein Drm3 [Striga asiatica]